MEKKGNALAWLALIVGILALILAWSAYNRAGADLETQVDEQVEETVDNNAAAVDAVTDEETDTDAEAEEDTAAVEDASAEVETEAVVE